MRWRNWRGSTAKLPTKQGLTALGTPGKEAGDVLGLGGEPLQLGGELEKLGGELGKLGGELEMLGGELENLSSG